MHGPLGQFASVVLQFIGEDGAALHVQLLTPVDVSGMLKELIKYHDNPKKRQKCSFCPPDARVGLITSRAASKILSRSFRCKKKNASIEEVLIKGSAKKSYTAHLAIPLIKRLYVEEHHLVVGAGHDSVVLTPRHEYNLVAKIPFAVSVPEIVIYPSDFITTKKIMRG